MSRTKRNKFAWMLATVALPVTSAVFTGDANADCTPATPVDGAIVDCTGTTTNPPAGYGINTATGAGITVNVGAGAFVTATTGDGITFLSGTVNNFGIINGGSGNGAAGIATGSNATINNSGSILGSAGANSFGVFVDNALTMTNTGTIQGVIGIFADDASTITNSSTIFGTGGTAIRLGDQNDSVTLQPGSNVIGMIDLRRGSDFLQNDGKISGSFRDNNNVQRETDGVRSDGILTVTNSGIIIGGADQSAIAGADVTVKNLSGGLIFGADNSTQQGSQGISANIARVENAGRILAAAFGIQANELTLTNFKDALISGGIGISAGTSNIDNFGTINGVAAAISGNDVTVKNLSGGTIKADGADGKAINATGTATVSNAGLIQSLAATGNAILAGAVDVINSGTIEAPGNVAIVSLSGDTKVKNSGTITGGAAAIAAAALADVTNDAGATMQATTSVTSQSTQTVSGFDVLLNNAGTITAGGVANNNVAVLAVNNATIQNSGNIQASGENSVAILGETVDVKNFGTIQATSGGFGIIANKATVNNFGPGVIASSLDAINASTSFVNNAGTIRSDLIGISGFTANVTNSGTIFGVGIGIRTTGSANVTNSGTISGSAGIVSEGLRGVGSNITNSGTIAGTGGTAIKLSPAADTLTLLGGSKIIGTIDMGGGDDVINIVNNVPLTTRVSSFFKLVAANTLDIINFTGILNANTTVNTGNMPAVQTGDSVATLDPTVFGQADRALMNFTSGVSSLVQGRLGGRAANGSTVQVVSFAPTGASGRTEEAFAAISAMGYAKERPRAHPFTYADAPYNVWTSGFGGTSTQKGDDTMLRSTGSAGAAVIGVDRQVRPDLLIGAFAGGGTGRLSVELNSQSVNTDYATAGVYGRFDWVSHFLDFMLQGGATTNKSTRLVLNDAGSETATASYDSWYISPEIAYGRRYHFGDGYTLTPVGRIRYLAGTFDGYSESGSVQNLVVNRRTVHDLEERAEVELSKITGVAVGSYRTNVHGGLIALQRLGNPTINTVLIGQDLSFTTPGKASSAGVVAGAGFDFRATDRMSLFGAVEATLMSDGSRTAAAKAGLMFAF